MKTDEQKLKTSLIFQILPLAMLLSGCAYCLHPYSDSMDVKLRIQAKRPEVHAVRVTATQPPSDYPVTSDGLVAFSVPPFRRGCSTYLFGVIKLADERPRHIRVIEIRRGERVVKRLSLEGISGLPLDETGCRIVKVR